MLPPISPLLTDLYQLTMLQAYVEHRMEAPAVFEFFVRRLPPTRGFLVAAGLESVLDYLESLRFSADDLEWLAQGERFSPSLLAYLERFRFTGDVDAMPEGTIFFPDEPILRVTAPLPQAQLVETRVMNLLHLQTLVASKAARCMLAADGAPLIDFGLRRAHGAEAGLLAARAAYAVGFAGTATVLAERLYGIPAYGTMAHSFVQAHLDEREAFEHFARAQPHNVTLLIDTYDTEAAAASVVALGRRLAEQGIRIAGVRLDSGDLAEHARRVRRILDEGGLGATRIVASGGMDEHAIERLRAQQAPIDLFAVGTALTTSADAPSLDCAYKLQEYAGRPTRKRSEGKGTWPGRKQVYRRYDGEGRMSSDVVTLLEDPQDGEALLAPVMRGGRRVAPSPSLAAIRERAATALATLAPPLRRLEGPYAYRVLIAPALHELAKTADQLADAAS